MRANADTIAGTLRLLEDTLMNIPLGVVMFNADGVIQVCNDRYSTSMNSTGAKCIRG